jgi:hypothetical protein
MLLLASKAYFWNYLFFDSSCKFNFIHGILWFAEIGINFLEHSVPPSRELKFVIYGHENLSSLTMRACGVEISNEFFSCSVVFVRKKSKVAVFPTNFKLNLASSVV